MIIRGWNFEPDQLGDYAIKAKEIGPIEGEDQRNREYSIGGKTCFVRHQGYFGNPGKPRVNIDVPDRETQKYVTRVLRMARRLDDIESRGLVIFSTQ